jgi:hypothetical protein
MCVVFLCFATRLIKGASVDYFSWFFGIGQWKLWVAVDRFLVDSLYGYFDGFARFWGVDRACVCALLGRVVCSLF